MVENIEFCYCLGTYKYKFSAMLIRLFCQDFSHRPKRTGRLCVLSLIYHFVFGFDLQDFLNMFFRDVYKPIPAVYNLVSAMLWRHPENFELDKVKVVHYCAAVRELICH